MGKEDAFKQIYEKLKKPFKVEFFSHHRISL